MSRRLLRLRSRYSVLVLPSAPVSIVIPVPVIVPVVIVNRRRSGQWLLVGSGTPVVVANELIERVEGL